MFIGSYFGDNIYITMLTRTAGAFRAMYGNLKDSDRIFTNVYRDADPFINGALKRVNIFIFRVIGIEPKIFLRMDQIGSSIKLRHLVLEEEEELVFHQASNTLSCQKSQPRNDQVI